MDKTLYVSYQCFIENPDFGIVVTLNDGKELFYQVMTNSYKVSKPKWKDVQAVAFINQTDIVLHTPLSDYLTKNKIDLDIKDPQLFKKLTEQYVLDFNVQNTVEMDIERKVKVQISNEHIPVVKVKI
jgi:hypothetical protein